MATAHASHVSEEEENFLRMQMLTNISPKAVRVLFDKIDKKFHPSCLETTIKKEYAKLFDLKIKRVINAAQWNSLFPCYGAPTSKTFDVTLMVVLIKNLTNLTPPASGYDSLPSSTDFSHIADVARIKHYRNQQAHCEDGKINTALFITAWQDISGALGRLGGPAMYEECKELRTKHLDQTTVPLNVKVKFIQTMGQWRKHDTNFIETRAAKHVLKCVQENSCVTVTGSFGIGKTATLRHVVLKMAEEGYDVLLDTNPHDIIKFHNPNQKTLFVIDDFCGKYSLNMSDVNNLEPVTKRIQELVRNKRTKIIVACRLQVYKDEKFKSLPIFRMKVCNLSSDDLCLSQLEKKSIAELYLETDTSEIISCCHIYDCFPLLCRLYHDNPERKNKGFFKNLSKVYKEEIEQFINNEHFGKYCALALCVIFNNQLPETVLIEEIGSHLRTRIENTCKECKLNKGTSRLFLLDELKSLENTFVKKEQGEYKTVHDNIFDFVSYYFRKKMIYCIIMNADCYFIMKRFLLEKKDDMDHSITIVPTEYHQMYIRRMICDWYNGYLFPVFNNINMDLSKFIRTFFDYLTALDIRVQSQLAKSPEGPVLVYCCSKGYIPFVEWCLYHDADVNLCTFDGLSPVFVSSQDGHLEILKILLDNKADTNICGPSGKSPLYMACQNGHRDIVKLLLANKADIDKCSADKLSPLFIACQQNYVDIATLLLDNKADINKYADDGTSALHMACSRGYTDIVKLLLHKKANVNARATRGASPLFAACMTNHNHDNVDIINLLLHNKADVNKCIDNEASPLYIACQNGLKDTVKLLLENKADINKCTNTGKSPLHIACLKNYVDIVKLLLNTNADINKCSDEGVSPLFIACKMNHIDIVKLLLDNNADIDQF